MNYRDNILALIDKQREKGMKKYGETLEDNVTLSVEQRIEHAEEELIDALQYLEHLKEAYKDNLTANDYQRMAMRTASGMQNDVVGEHGLLLNGLMGLNGEAGECVDILKKTLFQGHELDREHMIEELGDVAWYLAVACEGIGATLEEVMFSNVWKLMKRYPEGFDKARSINRNDEKTYTLEEVIAELEVDRINPECEDKEKAAVSEKVHRKTYLEDFLKNSPTLTAEDVVVRWCVKERYKSIPETSQWVCDKNCHKCWNLEMPEEGCT
jgi:NTP pyrophosphatase (non-canonical NTP hydrolase)